jgi:hypothetical protein
METESDREAHPGLGLDLWGREVAKKENETSPGLPQDDEISGALQL